MIWKVYALMTIYTALWALDLWIRITLLRTRPTQWITVFRVMMLRWKVTHSLSQMFMHTQLHNLRTWALNKPAIPQTSLALNPLLQSQELTIQPMKTNSQMIPINPLPTSLMNVISVYSKFHLFKILKIKRGSKQTYLLSRSWDRSEHSSNLNSKPSMGESIIIGFQKPSEKIPKNFSSGISQSLLRSNIEGSRTFLSSWFTIPRHQKKSKKFLRWNQDRPSNTWMRHLARNPIWSTWENCSKTRLSWSSGGEREASTNLRSSQRFWRLWQAKRGKSWWNTPQKWSQQAIKFFQSDGLSE